MMIRAFAAIDGSNNGQTVENARLQRQMFAYANAWHLCANGAEWSAFLDRRFGLRIPRIQVTWAAGEPKQNHGLEIRPGSGARFSTTAQDVGQREARDTGDPRLQKPPPRTDTNQVGGGRWQLSPAGGPGM